MSGKVDNKVAVLILQHPQEQDRALGTANLISETLGNAQLVVGLSWRNLAHALKEPAEARDWGVLYLGSAHAPGKGPLVAVTGKGEPMANQDGALAGLKGLVVLDGNWAQAKALWWRNAWVLKAKRLALNPAAKILIAPAMNGKMWLHPATQQNVSVLKQRGAQFIGPEKGVLSCGYEGLGRLWPCAEIAGQALQMLG